MKYVLGISAFYHDSAAALLRDGEIIAAAQEERFTRKKNDDCFPAHAIEFCLAQAGIDVGQLDAVVFYEKPILKFSRSLETFLAVAPAGLRAFLRVIPEWLSERLDVRGILKSELPGFSAPVFFAQHHQSHAASAFYPSPFHSAAILTIDGVGEYSTTTIGKGDGNKVETLKEIRFPHSLGLLYSAFTAYCGFRINSGEYKLMGLAPYGEPRFTQKIYDELIDLRDDGSFRLNLDYFAFLRGERMTNDPFDKLFGGPMRQPEAAIEERHLHVARSIQQVTEEVMLRLARHAKEITGAENLCMAGGVALNCVANGLIAREKIFKQIWIQPAAGDAGGALGAALAFWYSQNRRATPTGDAMRGSLLGPEFTDDQVEEALKRAGAVYEKLSELELIRRTAALLADEKVVAWCRGRMEFGPRALGNRSILGDPRSPKMQSVMNLKVKFRESFRPFAPVVRAERAAEYFDLPEESPYMLLVAPVAKKKRRSVAGSSAGLDRLAELRSEIPAVTHVDFSARVQTLRREQNPPLYALLEEFERLTGCPLLVNTSFNIRGEPIVCSPDDAYRCFLHTEMDYLVVNNFLLARSQQPARPKTAIETQPD